MKKFRLKDRELQQKLDEISGGEVEDVSEYDPKRWNLFPDVTPPVGVLMRIEEDDDTHCCGCFDGERWRIDGRDELGCVRRFRPWVGPEENTED